MFPSVLFVIWIFLLSGTSGQFDANFTLQNIWGRLPAQPGLRSMIQCVSSDTNTQGIKFSRKINTGQGIKLPKRSQQFLSGKPVFARIFLMPGEDKLNRFGAFQCKQTREGVPTEIVTFKLPPEGLVELDAAQPYIVANRDDDVELEVIVQKQQNLTLKWRHDGKDEMEDWDDQLKIQLNGVQESDAGIYECYYEGRRSESLHAILRLIVRKCPNNFYGDSCENECPPCYNGGICHDKWGVCVCPAGFTGGNCEQPCGGNHFGADCSKQCTPPQEDKMDEGCAFHLFCKPDPYGCSCAPGFSGPKCMDHCLPGWYGADCKQPCHCAFGVSSCNRITGACDGGCARGWRGSSCQIEDPNATPGPLGETTTMAHCPIGHYGPSCEKDCHCAGNEYCDIITGQCPFGCEQGWGGASCSACSIGRFGENCEHTCHCEGGDDNCDKDGFCLSGCQAGWAGFTCQQECTAGRFGVNCASTCHCKDGPSACDRVTGVCTGDCLPGFMGKDCQTMCPHDTYGINCVHACSCSNGGQCSRIDGTCSCEGRWRGTICNESEPQIIAATDEEVNVGQQTFISCTVDAIPQPTMNITSDKFPALSFHFRKLEQNQYQAVAKVKSSDAGDIDFSCTARNRHGFDQKIVTLSVIAPPRLLKQPELQSSGNTSLVVKWDEWRFGEDEGGKHGDSVEYMVVYRKIDSTEWLKPENWKNDRFSTLENLEPDTEYQVAVKCRRQGKGGEGAPGPLLNVKTDCGEPLPDAIPQQFIPETITSSSVKLTWSHPAESHLRCTLTAYKLEYYLESTPSDNIVVDIPDITDEIELDDLAAHSVYVFHLFPVTFFGQSKYFAELIIRTAESLPGPVRNVTCSSTDDAEVLVVTWKEPLVTAGIIKGYNVTYQLKNRSMCWTNPNDDYSSSTEKLTAFSTDTQLTLMNLYPYSIYLVSVQAITSAGRGNATSVTGTTAESSPDTGPPNLQLKSKTSTSLEFGWDPIPCEQANGKILDYEYTLVTSGLNELSHRTLQKRFVDDLVDAPKKVRGLDVTIENLEPHKEYGIAVRGNTDAGAGPFSEFLFEMTKEDVPPSPNLLDATPTNTSLTLSWSIPNPANGELIWYRLKYYVSNETKTDSYLTLNMTLLTTNDGVVTGKILGLQPATLYMTKVQASTNAGWGKWSDQMSAKTLDGVPGPPAKVTVETSTRTSLDISWEKPLLPNGVITGYEIIYAPLSTLDPSYNISAEDPLTVTSEGSLKRIVLENLRSSTQYQVQVSARTKAGNGPPIKENCWTVIVGEHVLPSIRPVLSEATNESIPITFSTVGKSSVQKYQIIVEDARNKHEIDEDLLSDYKTAVIKGGLPYYITAELDSSNVSDSGDEKFVVGDKKVYGGYQNVHLNTGHQYRVRIRTLIKKDQGTKSLLSEPQEYVLGHSGVPTVQTYNDEPKIFGMGRTLFIIIVASASVLLIALIFITTLCICRRRERRKKVSRSERDSGISESMTWSVMYKVSESEAVDGPLVSEGYKVMHGHDNCAMSLKKVKKNSKTSIGIKVENLPEYVHNATLGTRLSDEFSRLAAGQTAPWTVARRSENLKKNRYGNILPYDRHRVVLHFDQNGSGSDYINASYVDGYRRPKEYIVTQGPLECTVNDFWRMIWQESVPVIIMVTELVENGKQKCVQYWPDDSMVCGKLQILLIHSEQNTNFVIRTILMRSVEEGKTHRVHQYQYTEWPDKMIPDNSCFIIKMMKRIRNDHPVLGGPMVVHCSAGAGRSGTLVALDAITQQAEEEKRVDIFRYVNCARLQRINLVQTPEQYVFIHEALLEAIRYEDTSVPLEMIPLCLKELDNSHAHDYSSRIQRQYDLLNKTQKTVDINLCSAALSEYNIFKNRDPLTVPADSVRIRLESKSDDDDDYINAVKVNGYRQKDAFLVTQMPLENTVEDFWNLVYEHKSSLILMLNGCDTEDCLNIGQYWPSKCEATYGNFEVQVLTFEDQGEVIIRVMRLINHEEPHSEPHKVIQLQYKVWKEDLPPGPASMFNLLNTVELWYSRSSGGPITVHCLDGATRSGLFCAVSYVCGQIRAEESMDVYQMAKDIRINRPEFLSHLEQYRYCFEVAQVLAQFLEERNNTNSMTRKKLSCYV